MKLMAPSCTSRYNYGLYFLESIIMAYFDSIKKNCNIISSVNLENRTRVIEHNKKSHR